MLELIVPLIIVMVACGSITAIVGSIYITLIIYDDIVARFKKK